MVLAWALQQGISVVPRAARSEHILDNARLFGGPGGHGGGPDGVLLPGGTLSDAQIAAITALDGKLPGDDEPAAGTKKEIQSPEKGQEGRAFAVAATVKNLLPSEAQLYVPFISFWPVVLGFQWMRGLGLSIAARMSDPGCVCALLNVPNLGAVRCPVRRGLGAAVLLFPVQALVRRQVRRYDAADGGPCGGVQGL